MHRIKANSACHILCERIGQDLQVCCSSGLRRTRYFIVQWLKLPNSQLYKLSSNPLHNLFYGMGSRLCGGKDPIIIRAVFQVNWGAVTAKTSSTTEALCFILMLDLLSERWEIHCTHLAKATCHCLVSKASAISFQMRSQVDSSLLLIRMSKFKGSVILWRWGQLGLSGLHYDTTLMATE